MKPSREQVDRLWQACLDFRAADAGARLVAELAWADGGLDQGPGSRQDPELQSAIGDPKTREAAREFARRYRLDRKRFDAELAAAIASHNDGALSSRDAADPLAERLMAEALVVDTLVEMVARDFESELLVRGCHALHVRLLSEYSKFVLPFGRSATPGGTTSDRQRPRHRRK